MIPDFLNLVGMVGGGRSWEAAGQHRLQDGRPIWGHVDFMMANPPFNVDKVDAEAVKSDRRPPFGLPGVNKDKQVSNGNYMWISHFHSSLAPTGRAGFVMSSQASSAGPWRKGSAP